MAAANGQHKMEDLSAYLEICCRRIAENFNNKNVEDWTNGDFIRLSSMLSNKTNVLISPNTLKRIFRKIKTSSFYYPQKATRDALARYLGYTDWDGFMMHQPVLNTPVMVIPPPLADDQLALPPLRVHRSFRWKRSMSIAAAGIMLIAVLITWWARTGSVSDPNDSQLRVICTNPVGENPHSAIFKLISPTNFSDSGAIYRLEFGDGKGETVNFRDSLVSHYYEVPGRYFASFQRNGIALDTLPVYLQTSGWTATATVMFDTSRVYPVDLPSTGTNGQLAVNALDVYHAGVDTNRTFFVRYVNTKPLEISGDNFELSTELVTSPMRPGVRCSQVSIQVLGEHAFHRILAMKPGCAAWLALKLSEKTKNGKTSDLRSFGQDFSTGGNITVRVANQVAEIFFNGKMVYRDTYTVPIQKIYGVNIEFSGTGTVKHFNLKDLGTGLAFEDAIGL